jgi:hypothetical protein
MPRRQDFLPPAARTRSPRVARAALDARCHASRAAGSILLDSVCAPNGHRSAFRDFRRFFGGMLREFGEMGRAAPYKSGSGVHAQGNLRAGNEVSCNLHVPRSSGLHKTVEALNPPRRNQRVCSAAGRHAQNARSPGWRREVSDGLTCGLNHSIAAQGGLAIVEPSLPSPQRNQGGHPASNLGSRVGRTPIAISSAVDSTYVARRPGTAVRDARRGQEHDRTRRSSRTICAEPRSSIMSPVREDRSSINGGSQRTDAKVLAASKPPNTLPERRRTCPTGAATTLAADRGEPSGPHTLGSLDSLEPLLRSQTQVRGRRRPSSSAVVGKRTRRRTSRTRSCTGSSRRRRPLMAVFYDSEDNGNEWPQPYYARWVGQAARQWADVSPAAARPPRLPA